MVEIRLNDVSQMFEGREVLHQLTHSFHGGCVTAIAGANGSGKSTLLRAIAGIWPFGGGDILAPAGSQILFLPQRPYLPLGTLRRAICYPLADENAVDSATLEDILRRVDLAALIPRLDDVDDWSRILSLGEQQRIAFARILVVRPDWVFLDEATSALDEPREEALYQLLHETLPQTGFVSVGHRQTLFARHDKELHMEGGNAVLRDIIPA